MKCTSWASRKVQAESKKRKREKREEKKEGKEKEKLLKETSLKSKADKAGPTEIPGPQKEVKKSQSFWVL
eukprot:scaffold15314_cov80-Attheya_sp.AAC.2